MDPSLTATIDEIIKYVAIGAGFVGYTVAIVKYITERTDNQMRNERMEREAAIQKLAEKETLNTYIVNTDKRIDIIREDQRQAQRDIMQVVTESNRQINTRLDNLITTITKVFVKGTNDE